MPEQAASLPGDSRAFQTDAGDPENETNETTAEVRHRDPNRISEEGNPEAVESNLVDELTGRLHGSVEKLREGDYGDARTQLDDGYQTTLAKYARVSRESGEESTTAAFRRAARNERQFVNAVASYRNTSRQYRAAKQAGKDERAHELARALERQATNISEHGTVLIKNLRTIEQRTDEDLGATIDLITEIRGAVQARLSSVQSTQFVRTNLSAETDDPRASFTDPLRIDGQIVTENGTPVSDRTVTIHVGNRTYTTETDGDGQFTVRYRPTTLPLSAQSVNVSYAPANGTDFAGSNATVPIEVKQVSPEVTVTSLSDRATYGDEIAVNGRVEVNETPAPGVPVVVTADGVVVGEAQTGSDGRFGLRTTLPSAVRAGERRMTTAVALENRSLANASDNGTLIVEPTRTALNLSAVQTSNGSVVVTGTLQAADGRRLDNRSVSVSLGGVQVTTLETNNDGEFTANVTVPERRRPQRGNATIAVEARFNGNGTSLESTRARTHIEVSAEPRPLPFGLPGSGDVVGTLVSRLNRYIQLLMRTNAWGSTRIGGIRTPIVTVGMAVGTGVLIGGILYTGSVLFRSNTDDTDQPDAWIGEDDVSASADAPAGLRAEMHEHLKADETDRAVSEAYTLARHVLSGWTGVRNWGTHWEFYWELERADRDIDLTEFRRLTEIYESAAFAAEQTDPERAEEAVETAERLLNGNQD